jgi:V/A-type H+-transporting ATPase subunit A
MEVLQKESELQEIVQLVGSDALPEAEQVTIEIARMLREIFLQQNAYDAVDAYCSMEKQFDLLKAIRRYADLAYGAQKNGFSISAIIAVKSKNELARIKYIAEYKAELDKILKEMDAEFAKIKEA